MQSRPPSSSLDAIFELPRGRVLTLTVQQPVELACCSGHIWLSVSGRDVVLRSGQRFVIPRSHAVVLEALQGEARIAFVQIPPATPRGKTANVALEVRLPAGVCTV